jgi:N-acetylneuraminic acid mutarotase
MIQFIVKTVWAASITARWVSSAPLPSASPPADSASIGIWATLPNITMNGTQYPRQEQSVVLVDDEMYLLGGVIPSDGSAFPTVCVQKFNFITNTWTKVAPIPVALNHVNVAVVHGLIYYLGGLAVTASGGPGFWNAFGACAVYDPSADKWIVLPDMPEGRAAGSAATMVVGDTIYLPGGLLNTNLTNDEEGTTAMFSSYNIVTREWAILEDLPAPRDHAGKGQYGNMLYILGGRLYGHWNVVDTVFGYDIATDCWSTDFPPMSTGRGGYASASIGSKMFTAGGDGDLDTTSNVWPQMQAYDAVTNSWTNYTDVAIPVHGPGAVVYQRKVVIPGGGVEIGGAPTRIVQSFTPY